MKRYGCFLTALAALMPVATDAATTLLSPATIQATFGTGKPFTADSATGSASFTFVLKPDGTATRTSKRKNSAPVSGTWRVDDKGYCSKWGGGTETCYSIEKNGNRYSVRNGAGKVVSHWSL